ncbi:MAG: hypothetical protein WBP29_11695 [Candidatus Zixiibacteriota bacterium]
MKTRILIAALLTIAALAVIGCEEKKYIVIDDAIPAAPVGVYSVTGDGYVDIYWPLNNDGGITEDYAVYYYAGTEGNQDVYELLAKGNDIDFIMPDYIYTDEARGYYRDYDVSNGVTYRYAVSAYNENGESDLSAVDAFDTPRPEGSDMVRDYHTYPSDGGFDFSRARVVDWDDATSDVYFEFDPNLDAFFFFAGDVDVDIMDYGYTDALNSVGWGDPGEGDGWSEVGWMELTLGHSYIVWTADNHYATFRVTNLSVSNISIDWAYQTDEGNPDLKRAPKVSPPHAENYGRRSGN